MQIDEKKGNLDDFFWIKSAPKHSEGDLFSEESFSLFAIINMRHLQYHKNPTGFTKSIRLIDPFWLLELHPLPPELILE